MRNVQLTDPEWQQIFSSIIAGMIAANPAVTKLAQQLNSPPPPPPQKSSANGHDTSPLPD